MNAVFLVADYQPSVNGPETMDGPGLGPKRRAQAASSALAVQE
jgi:hypothetical protein